MANRLMVRNMMTLEKAPVVLYAQVAIGSTGAPTLTAAKSLGIKTIARNDVGKYTLTLGGPVGYDTYKRGLMFARGVVIAATSTAVGMCVVSDGSASSTPTVVIQFLDKDGAAVELANGVTALIELTLSNTSV